MKGSLMDNVILLLYLADVCAGITGSFVCVCLLSFIIFIVIGIYSITDGKKEKQPKILAKCFLALMLFSYFVIVFTPKKEVILAFAAKEAIARAVDTDIGSKALSLIEKKLDEELAK